ncbi:pentatricopeptide repeat-containing protein [Pyrus ussuriensis x Pyrus communis]|uniref:Pentatricopeptide repeat-containing protein n=1 Tax=Pyrus ussuriensis x Pyrus communis TaxID=2448454 RepID=A0A5N5GDG7_9ROSA|nr:pentatricopeptide repeat-containing protein [Pyrus ussuriensis x Pyrus communis]
MGEWFQTHNNALLDCIFLILKSSTDGNAATTIYCRLNGDNDIPLRYNIPYSSADLALTHLSAEEAEHERHEFGLGNDLEDGVKGGAGVVEVGLAAGPIEELEAGEDIMVVAAVAEDLEEAESFHGWESQYKAAEGGYSE